MAGLGFWDHEPPDVQTSLASGLEEGLWYAPGLVIPLNTLSLSMASGALQ